MRALAARAAAPMCAMVASRSAESIGRLSHRPCDGCASSPRARQRARVATFPALLPARKEPSMARSEARVLPRGDDAGKLILRLTLGLLILFHGVAKLLNGVDFV